MTGLKRLAFLFPLFFVVATAGSVSADTTVVLTTTAVEYTLPPVPMVLQNVATEYARGLTTPMVLQNTAIEYLRFPDRPVVLRNVGIEFTQPFTRPVVLTNFAVEYEPPFWIPRECAIRINDNADTTTHREVSVVLSAVNATSVSLPAEAMDAVDSQALIPLPPADADGRSETTIVVQLSAGSGVKILYARFVNEFGASPMVQASIYFRENALPGAPTGIMINGREAFGIETNDTRPIITWSHNDPDSDPQSGFVIQIARDLNYQDLAFEIAETGPAGSASEFRIPEPGLEPGKTYLIRIRTADSDGFGVFSHGSHSFRIVPTEQAPVRPRQVDLIASATSIKVFYQPIELYLKNFIQVSVYNIGAEAAENVTVSFYDDGDLIGSTTIGELAAAQRPGSDKQATIEWTPTRIGFHTIKVVVDPAGLLNEDNVANNTATRAFPVGEVDTSSAMSVTAEFLSPGEVKTIYVGLKVSIAGHSEYNPFFTTGGPVQGARVRVRAIGAQTTGEIDTDVLAEGVTNDRGDFGVSFITPWIPGSYAMRVEVSDGTITGLSDQLILNVVQLEGIELVYYDNEVRIDPYLVMPANTRDPLSPKVMTAVEDSPVIIMVPIHNVGTVAAENVVVRFYDEDTHIGDVVLPEVPASGSVMAEIGYQFPVVGIDWVRIIIDPENRIEEASERMGLPTNNSGDPWVRVLPNLPDLEIADIIFNPLRVKAPGPTDISAKIWNIGGVRSNACKVRFDFPGATTAQWEVTINRIFSGKFAITPIFTDTLPIPYIDYFCTGTVDVNNKNTEYAEGNNQMVESIYPFAVVQGGGPSIYIDPAVSEIELLSNYYPDGQYTPQYFISDSGTVIITVTNIWAIDCPHGFTLEFSIDGVFQGDTAIPALLGNQSCTRAFYVPENTLTAGLHDFTGHITGIEDFERGSQANNTLTRRKAIFALTWNPFAAAMQFAASPRGAKGVDPGKTVTIWLTVGNDGRDILRNTVADFFVGFNYLGTVAIPELPPNEVTDISIPYTPQNVGFEVIRATVRTPEPDLTPLDNTISKILIVGNPLELEIVPGTFRIAPSPLLTGETAYLEVEVRNNGTLFDANNVSVAFRDADTIFYEDFRTTVASATVNVSKNGGTVTARAEWQLPYCYQGGNEHLLWAMVDPDLFFPERNKQNNIDSQPVLIAGGSLPPPPVITQPRDGQYFPEASVVIAGQTVRNSTVKLYEAGTEIEEFSSDGAGLFDGYGFFSEGVHTISASAILNCSMVTDSSAPVTFVVDMTAPIITIHSPVTGAQYAPNDSLVINFTVEDNLDPAPVINAWLTNLTDSNQRDVVNGQTINVLDLAAGLWMITVEAEDRAGNQTREAAGPFAVIHDLLPPRTTLTIGEPRYGDSPTSISAATPLSLTAVDDLIAVGDGLGLGVETVEYMFAGVTREYTGPFSIVTEGPVTLSYFSTDIVGNREQATVIDLVIDNTAPLLEIVIGEPKLDGDPIIITNSTPIGLTAIDLGVGLQPLVYSIDGGDWVPYAGFFTIATGGAHFITARARDWLGNETEKYANVVMDNEPPTIIIAPVASPTNQDVTLAYTVTDNVTPSEQIAVTGDASPYTAEGAYTVVLTATDLAGNSATATVGFTIDKTTPVTTLTVGSPSSNGFVTTVTPLTLTATDNLTAVPSVRYRLDNGEWLTYAGAFTLTGEGAHLVEFYAADEAGNTEAVQSATLTVDGSAPLSSLTIDLASADGAIAVPESAITLTATDTGCGVEKIEYRVNGGSWATYGAPFELGSVTDLGQVTVGYRATDRLGNAEAERTATWEVRRALDLTIGLLTMPRVLCWWNEESGDGHPARDEWEPALAAVLDAAALDYLIVETPGEFLANLANYNVYLIVGDEGELEDEGDSLVAAQVALGKTLVSFGYEDIKTPDEEDQGWENIFGIKVAGVLNGTVHLAAYPDLAAETTTLTVEGQTERITEVLAGEVLGEATLIERGDGGEERGSRGRGGNDDGEEGHGRGDEEHGQGSDEHNDTWPAIVANTWGAGRTLYLAPEYGRNLVALAGVLENAITWARPATEIVAPGGVVGVTVNVRNAVLPVTLRVYVEAFLPTGSDATAVYDGGTDQGNVVVWAEDLAAGADGSYRFLLRLPPEPGPYTVRVEASYSRNGSYRVSDTCDLVLP